MAFILSFGQVGDFVEVHTLMHSEVPGAEHNHLDRRSGCSNHHQEVDIDTVVEYLWDHKVGFHMDKIDLGRVDWDSVQLDNHMNLYSVAP